MKVDLPDTTTNEVNRHLVALREEHGVVAFGRVLTLLVCVADNTDLETAIEAAVEAGREHPCRIIVLVAASGASESRMDAQIRMGGEDGFSEIIVLHTHGEMSRHQASVVIPFLLPDTPVVAWWPGSAPDVPSEDPVGRLARRRITDATRAADPTETVRLRCRSYAPGDTDLAWALVTHWRAILASALDEPPFEPVRSAVVSGSSDQAALDLLAGWLAARLGCPVVRKPGPLQVDLVRDTSSITLAGPQRGRTATLERTDRPLHELALARRKTWDCLAEDLRHMDTDEIYASALRGVDDVSFL